MFQIPDYTNNVSFRLCEVLDEIGVNPRILQKRRTSWLLKESIHMVTNQLEDDNSSVYYFGSQTESTTTIGLDSDCDCLLTFNDFNVIQDQRDRVHGLTNLLMIQDENVSPGYCLLQHLGDGVLHPHDELNEYYFRDKMGRMVLKNTVFTGAAGTGALRHGPAYSEHGRPGIYNTDLVYALPCRSWPIQATNWLGPYKTRLWPSDAMQKYCSSTGCFAVAVGSNNSEKEEFEWRISTSLAERSLIFSLNISQIRCYILMKMILKTFICPKMNDVISSFMCKTVLLRCIANTHANTWREHNLLSCLTFCLSSLYYCVLNENCPHFIIPENNLMAGKLSAESKSFIVRVLLELVNSNGRAMLQIHCDRLGFILQNKFSVVTVSGEPKNFLSKQISGQLSKEIALHINDGVKDLLSQINETDDMQAVSQIISKYIFKLVSMYTANQGLQKIACSLIAPWLYTTLGSVLASFDISCHNNLSSQALTQLLFGLKSDASSSKLKLASIFYCFGDIHRMDRILRYTEACYDVNVVEPVCTCYSVINQARKKTFNTLSFHQNHKVINHMTASCVKFLPFEINCCPNELRHEMFRCTAEDKLDRGYHDYWMDWAVVDSLPYLYFLKYKAYDHLRKHEDKQTALSNLVKTIDKEPNLRHRETALNLLGQCMEQENRMTDALCCYTSSLQVKSRNNAARLHISRLVNTMINDS